MKGDVNVGTMAVPAPAPDTALNSFDRCSSCRLRSQADIFSSFRGRILTSPFPSPPPTPPPPPPAGPGTPPSSVVAADAAKFVNFSWAPEGAAENFTEGSGKDSSELCHGHQWSTNLSHFTSHLVPFETKLNTYDYAVRKVIVDGSNVIFLPIAELFVSIPRTAEAYGRTSKFSGGYSHNV